jgi:hypothetical protein
MANDIVLAVSGLPIKNGSTVVTCSAAGEYAVIDTEALLTPVIDTIEDKYTDRFDDPSYYYGNGTQGT